MSEIKNFSDKDLLALWQSNCKHRSLAKDRPELYRAAGTYTLAKDHKEILEEIERRLPANYFTDFEKFMSTPVIQPGAWYRHRSSRSVRIQICDDAAFKGPLWSVRALVNGNYIHRFIIKETALLENYMPDAK